MKNVLLILFYLFLSYYIYSQTDTEFWFAAPDISSNSASFDIPIFIRLSTLNQPATVTISQPANTTFVPIVVNMAANSSATVDLSAFLILIENAPPNCVLNKGIKIQSTTRISAYYEVASTYCYCNPEIFALCGKNALGTLFYTPFQTFTNNSPSYNPLPYCSFQIVATENNTLVTITPSQNVVGNLAGAPYTILMDKGQSYSAQATSQAANQHLAGSKIVSDKPVAVTDTIFEPARC